MAQLRNLMQKDRVHLTEIYCHLQFINETDVWLHVYRKRDPMGWCGSCRGGVGHAGVEWVIQGGVGHAGVEWVIQGGVGHAGVEWVM